MKRWSAYSFRFVSYFSTLRARAGACGESPAGAAAAAAAAASGVPRPPAVGTTQTHPTRRQGAPVRAHKRPPDCCSASVDRSSCCCSCCCSLRPSCNRRLGSRPGAVRFNLLEGNLSSRSLAFLKSKVLENDIRIKGPECPLRTRKGPRAPSRSCRFGSCPGASGTRQLPMWTSPDTLGEMRQTTQTCSYGFLDVSCGPK